MAGLESSLMDEATSGHDGQWLLWLAAAISVETSRTNHNWAPVGLRPCAEHFMYLCARASTPCSVCLVNITTKHHIALRYMDKKTHYGESMPHTATFYKSFISSPIYLTKNKNDTSYKLSLHSIFYLWYSTTQEVFTPSAYYIVMPHTVGIVVTNSVLRKTSQTNTILSCNKTKQKNTTK